MIWMLKLEQTVEEWLILYRNIVRGKKIAKDQIEIAMYFHEATPASPSFPSISSTSSTPTTLRHKANRLLLPLCQPTRSEDGKDKGLYCDQLPLNE